MPSTTQPRSRTGAAWSGSGSRQGPRRSADGGGPQSAGAVARIASLWLVAAVGVGQFVAALVSLAVVLAVGGRIVGEGDVHAGGGAAGGGDAGDVGALARLRQLVGNLAGVVDGLAGGAGHRGAVHGGGVGVGVGRCGDGHDDSSEGGQTEGDQSGGGGEAGPDHLSSFSCGHLVWLTRRRIGRGPQQNLNAADRALPAPVVRIASLWLVAAVGVGQF